jgi:hypothetical protein
LVTVHGEQVTSLIDRIIASLTAPLGVEYRHSTTWYGMGVTGPATRAQRRTRSGFLRPRFKLVRAAQCTVPELMARVMRAAQIDRRFGNPARQF